MSGVGVANGGIERLKYHEELVMQTINCMHYDEGHLNIKNEWLSIKYPLVDLYETLKIYERQA